MMPVPLVLAGKAVVQARESTMEPAPVERAGVKSTAVETRQIHRGNPRRPRAALLGRVLAGRGPPRPGAQLQCSPRTTFSRAGLRYCLIKASMPPYHNPTAQGYNDDPAGFMSGYVLLMPAAPIALK